MNEAIWPPTVTDVASAKLAPCTTIVVPPETVPALTDREEIAKEQVTVAVSPNRSVTVKSVVERPTEVGVPVIAPVESIASPSGRALPGLRETTLGPTPAAIVRAELNTTPTVPTMDCGAVIVGAADAICVLTVDTKFAKALAAAFTAAPAASAEELALVAVVVNAVSSAFNFFTAAISGVV